MWMFFIRFAKLRWYCVIYIRSEGETVRCWTALLSPCWAPLMAHWAGPLLSEQRGSLSPCYCRWSPPPSLPLGRSPCPPMRPPRCLDEPQPLQRILASLSQGNKNIRLQGTSAFIQSTCIILEVQYCPKVQASFSNQKIAKYQMCDVILSGIA